MKILLSYTFHPASTAAYVEKALRKRHEVITYGPKVDDSLFGTDVIKAWGLESIRQRVKSHDIPLFSSSIEDVFHRLPIQWRPDLFLWIETGLNYPMKGIEKLPCPTACYFMDTNFHFEQHLEIARRFDVVFLALKPYVQKFKEKGFNNVFWVPVACDPETHGKRDGGKLYDIGFVGTITNSKRRAELIGRIGERFHFYYERCFLERMAEVFSQSRIVFNVQPVNGLNMRVFEAMASGSMLLTDETEGSGLSSMFEDKKHLVIYHNEEELFRLADHYLSDQEERERIAGEGMREVLTRHTYEQRVETMIAAISSLSLEEQCDSLPNASRVIPTDSNKKREHFLNQMEWMGTFIPAEAKKVLDVGCREGALGKMCIKKGAEEVIGIEADPIACETAKNHLSDVMCGDIEKMFIPFEEGYFDCIVFADILERLKDPLLVVKRLKASLSDSGVMVACIYNVRYWGVINMLAEGHWKYQEYGILDWNHLRFFTKREIGLFFEKAGMVITDMAENIDDRYEELDPSISKELVFGRITLHDLTPEEIKALFVTRYLIRAVKAGGQCHGQTPVSLNVEA